MTDVAVPYMVDASRDPIDFKILDKERVAECATRTKCGVCGQRIKRGPVAFVGPNDGRRCFADPWMHPACAERSMIRCPFLSGRRDWSEAEARSNPLLATYSSGMVIVTARNWRAHRDQFGAWHFEAVGELTMAARVERRRAFAGGL